MKRYYCDCKAEIFFENLKCYSCNRAIAFDPASNTLITGSYHSYRFVDKNQNQYRTCSHRENYVNCNWLIGNDEPHEEQCISCRTTEVVPNQDLDFNKMAWTKLESCKRRLFYSLIQLRLPLLPKQTKQVLRFHFLEDKQHNPNVTLEKVMTGHQNGLITINSAEADGFMLRKMKKEMNESYRTLLGHFRHEIGHFYWYELIQDTPRLKQFRALFGDERVDYQQSLKSYYQKQKNGELQIQNWRESYISAYSQSHPFEDWAETWAHCLHMFDGLETVAFYQYYQYGDFHNLSFDDRYLLWLQSTQFMNALNRAMGLNDPYPFTITQKIKEKLQFIDSILTESVSH